MSQQGAPRVVTLFQLLPAGIVRSVTVTGSVL